MDDLNIVVLQFLFNICAYLHSEFFLHVNSENLDYCQQFTWYSTGV